MDSDKLQLLLVEDDIDLATAVIDYFDLENIHCEHASNGLSGFNLIETNHYDVVILDLNSGEITTLKVYDLELNTKQRTISKNSTALKLSPISFKILETLMRAYPNPVSRENLMQSVWGDEQPDSNSLKVHMFNLRKVIESNHNGIKQKLIHTIVGHGFVLKDESQS